MYPKHVLTQTIPFSRGSGKWPIHFLEKAVPQLMPIIYELNSRVVKKFDDKSVAIIDDERRVHMHTWISIMVTASTVLHTFTQRS